MKEEIHFEISTLSVECFACMHACLSIMDVRQSNTHSFQIHQSTSEPQTKSMAVAVFLI